MLKNKGPLLNRTIRKINNRDPLGIQGVSQGIVGNLCPIVNSVTPHAMYWIFVNWIYYDLYENKKTTDLSDKVLSTYIKKLNYFMILANVINSTDTSNMVGLRNIKKIDFNADYYSYDEEYIQTLTGVNYYRAALTSTSLITYKDKDGTPLQHLKFTTRGEALALSIDKTVRNTEFYKKFIARDIYDNIPRKVLIEFGKAVNFNLVNLDESKKLLRQFFFEKECKISDIRNLYIQSEFIRYLYTDLELEKIDDDVLRDFLFDYYSPRSKNNRCPEMFVDKVRGWEVLVSRHYLTNALEMLFSYVQRKIKAAIDIDKFIHDLLKNNDTDISLESFLKKCTLNGREIDGLLSIGKSKKTDYDKENIVKNAITILLTIYNRLNNRNDLNKVFLLADNEATSISTMRILDDVEKYKKEKLITYMEYVLKEYIFAQHRKTAERKMLLKEDTFFMGFYNNIVYPLDRVIFEYDYQNLRINSLFQVMKELDMLGDK